MKIQKVQTSINNQCNKEIFYKNARTGIHNIVSVMVNNHLIDTILLPGYIGWSPREGSGIFDSISSINQLNIIYYKMDSTLQIDFDDLRKKVLGRKCLVLLVNYFGFRDRIFHEIVKDLKKSGHWVMEDNAHGFYTWHLSPKFETDIIVFSFHKMFPFKTGGSVIIKNPNMPEMTDGASRFPVDNNNPYTYNFVEISDIRKDNFLSLAEHVEPYEKKGFFTSLRKVENLQYNTPQTYPILINVGDRNKVYEKMNAYGYGVVSLYHTMIEPLRNCEFRESNEIACKILNLPVHQDVDKKLYADMMKKLYECCVK